MCANCVGAILYLVRISASFLVGIKEDVGMLRGRRLPVSLGYGFGLMLMS
jgi:hypothetical protein